MFNHQIANLRVSIEWALRDQSLDIFRMASVQLSQLESCITSLAEQEQLRLYSEIEQILPMEWPLWMEACRYNDVAVQPLSKTIH